MLRLVLDTNVWLDWLVFKDAGLEPLRKAHAAGKVEAVIDEACDAELQRVLAYDLGKYRLDASRQERTMEEMRKISSKVTTFASSLPRCADPDDQKFLELAASAKADALVTKDMALLDLAGRVPFRIVTPKDLGLLLAYQAAEYVVFGEPELVIRIGELNPDLDELMQAHEATSAAFVTAANPHGEKKSAEENEERLAGLRASSYLIGHAWFEGEGRDSDEPDPARRWTKASLLVLGLERADAMAIGIAHDQNAIVFCEKGRPPELLLLT